MKIFTTFLNLRHLSGFSTKNLANRKLSSRLGFVFIALAAVGTLFTIVKRITHLPLKKFRSSSFKPVLANSRQKKDVLKHLELLGNKFAGPDNEAVIDKFFPLPQLTEEQHQFRTWKNQLDSPKVDQDTVLSKIRQHLENDNIKREDFDKRYEYKMRNFLPKTKQACEARALAKKLIQNKNAWLNKLKKKVELLKSASQGSFKDLRQEILKLMQAPRSFITANDTDHKLLEDEQFLANIRFLTYSLLDTETQESLFHSLALIDQRITSDTAPKTQDYADFVALFTRFSAELDSAPAIWQELQR